MSFLMLGRDKDGFDFPLPCWGKSGDSIDFIRRCLSFVASVKSSASLKTAENKDKDFFHDGDTSYAVVCVYSRVRFVYCVDLDDQWICI